MLCLGHILAEDGRKMSKHLGNMLEPIALMDGHGADAVRWFFAASGSPWGQRRVGPAVLEEIVRKVLADLLEHGRRSWCCTRTRRFRWRRVDAGVRRSAPAAAERPLLDRWVLSELHACVRDVTAALEAFDTAAAGRRIAALIDDLSNWYVRRSRRRFWEGPSGRRRGGVRDAARGLVVLTKLMAPVTPFLADYVWGVLRPRRLARIGAPDVVAVPATRR